MLQRTDTSCAATRDHNPGGELETSSERADDRVADVQRLAAAVDRRGGVPEVSTRWVHENQGRLRLVDVREAAELAVHGKVAWSEHVPLGRFLAFAEGLDRRAPIVVMCASGGRSGRAVRALERAGFTACASMQGGVFGWRANALPVV